jgi:20S proteasome subunit beta 2
MGSGSLASMSVFESEWREDMNEAEATELVKKGILAGIYNDLGSGSNVDTCVIRMDGTKTLVRGALVPNQVAPIRALINHSSKLTMNKGTTAVLKTTFVPNAARAAALARVSVTTTATPMETSA